MCVYKTAAGYVAELRLLPALLLLDLALGSGAEMITTTNWPKDPNMARREATGGHLRRKV
jgi:hypothetical protein